MSAKSIPNPRRRSSLLKPVSQAQRWGKELYLTTLAGLQTLGLIAASPFFAESSSRALQVCFEKTGIDLLNDADEGNAPR
ncbi:hypothetical protein BOTBODRAFT_56652 [Botryobasidium botryosum FD-172 SS1]|uniref:Uncharacterized protein n=1 Tax=Botryobasidium botryosum (strain FD-172 SS1) TaxID=930990 RepID=A0A067MAJ2_BOTB1|nr:hypothetical protein BOTBODRAFT_56652 [Botryobasidium botryosum FD-172 SS1]